MKTTPFDFLLSTVSIGLLLLVAVLTTWLISADTTYRIIIDLVAFLFFYGLYTAAFLALLRRIRPYPVGDFSMDAPEFTYWKLVAVLTDLGEKAWRPFTTVFTQSAIFSAFGANVGRNVAFAGTIRDLPLITFGDDCTVGQNSVITAHAITGAAMTLQPVAIGPRAVVGINCVVMPGVSIGPGAVLAPGAVATLGTIIPADELWGGIPAKKIKALSRQRV